MELARIQIHLWLLLLHFGGALSLVYLKDNRLPDRCKYLLEDEMILERKCGGTYPLLAFTKFRDTFVKAGEPFSLFMPNTMDHIMVVLKDSALQNCARFQLSDMATFFCLDNKRNETIRLDFAHMYCFPFHIQLPDDLMLSCLAENNMVDKYLNDVLRTRRGVIHYTFNDSRGHRHISVYFWSLLLPLLLLLLFSRQ
ncbi:uncharacterized protein LOC108147641 [Drosophila elegans]|uniref:uncharacterized protein LOC108147641 n=1 Tax=Drosophila elegans TaxID=30023 RepID=UPI0007E5DCB0|nr:uncharacterized protein LOC108147641 [Drosophila elegans]